MTSASKDASDARACRVAARQYASGRLIGCALRRRAASTPIASVACWISTPRAETAVRARRRLCRSAAGATSTSERAVAQTEPEAIIHEATALADAKFGRNFDRTFAQTDRLRTEGTDNLLDAARENGVSKFIAQSFASMRAAREGGMVKSEDDPLDPDPPEKMREGFAAMRHLDEAVTAAGGIALRYGGFYGDDNDGWADLVRNRRFPMSATEVATSPSFTWTTPRRPPPSRSTTTGRRFTTSSTTIPHRRANGYPFWPTRSEPSRRVTYPSGWPGCSAATLPS